MEKVLVKTEKSYECLIGRGLLKKCGSLIKETVSAKTIAIVTDDLVDRLYSQTVEVSLKQQGFETVKYVFKNGEASKNISVFSEMLEFMAQSRLTRGDCILALGGGVVGDMAGFCAATYLRGVPYIQLPTTLLAMVDSSVGGKTAIDLRAGKNLAGAFYQPELVIADVDTLATLKAETFADGMAETIKYGVLFDREFFDFLKENDASGELEKIVKRCIEFKRDTVERDETEKGERALLNLGHTIGHAIEKCSSYTVTHGSAVAAGMCIIAKGAYRCGLCEENIYDELVSILKKYGLPTESTFTSEQLFDMALSDKKMKSDGITLVIPEKIGRCRLLKAELSLLKDIIEKGTGNED
ncbi:MAG: 3-dehydroquinate synthase [Clostridia bacterium]|nr:3-dehydroquinate synthase [Clostridia bacterium]